MYIELLTQSLKKKFEDEKRDGVHVSDLVLCPRKAVFRKLNPEPLTMRDLNFFTSGRAIHDAIQTLAKSYEVNVMSQWKPTEQTIIQDRFDIEREVEYDGIVGHIDLYDSEKGVPIECKSARKKEQKEPMSHHVAQLKSYMAMTDSDRGIILYQLLMHFDDKPFVEFEVTMTKEERMTHLQKLLVLKALYLEAIEKKDPMIVPDVLHNADLNWLCKSCPHLKKCCDNDNKEKIS